MKKNNTAEQLAHLHKENISLRADLNAITDVFADFYRAHGGWRRNDFDKMLLKPKKDQHLPKLIMSHPFLSNEEKTTLSEELLPGEL